MLTSSRVEADHQILFAGPQVITVIMAEQFDASPQRPAIERLVKEYASIYRTLISLVNPYDLVVIENSLKGSKAKKIGFIEHYIDKSLPGINTQQVESLSHNYKYWPRDAFILAGGAVLPGIRAFNLRGTSIEGSVMGTGGAVLTGGNVILVAEDVFTIAKQEGHIQFLTEKGYEVEPLPVLPELSNNHIDGVMALVQDKWGEPLLLVASSYYERLGESRFDFEIAVLKSATRKIIDDKGFPSMAFNLIQLDDGAIAMTSGATSLEVCLKDIIGRDSVYTTDIPIELFPVLSGGSIRCLTNKIPRWVLGISGNDNLSQFEYREGLFIPRQRILV